MMDVGPWLPQSPFVSLLQSAQNGSRQNGFIDDHSPQGSALLQ